MREKYTKVRTKNRGNKMSGGEFEYMQFQVAELSEMVKRSTTSWALTDGDGWNGTDKEKEIIMDYICDTVLLLNKAELYTHKLDWFLSGDTGLEDLLDFIAVIAIIKEEKRILK